MIGTGYCFQHLRKYKHLRIGTSTLAGAGKGLFAYDKAKGVNDIVFKEGEEIIPYDGELIDEEELDNRYTEHYTAPYGIEISKIKDLYEDGALHRGVGSLVNHANMSKADVRFSITKKDRVVLRATKAIRNNQELFVNYGREYRFSEPTSNTTKFV